MPDAPSHILSAVRRAGAHASRLRYEVSGDLATIRGMCFGVCFIDAPWSAPSRSSFASLTHAIARLDKGRRLELVVVGIDGAPGLADIPELRNHIGGWGEAAWVYRGHIIHSSADGQAFIPYTEELLGRERYPVVSVPLPATARQLADYLCNGEDCGFALHDALVEGGHPDLAEHFRQETVHPKGCWALDLILGKG